MTEGVLGYNLRIRSGEQFGIRERYVPKDELQTAMARNSD